MHHQIWEVSKYLILGAVIVGVLHMIIKDAVVAALKKFYKKDSHEEK